MNKIAIITGAAQGIGLAVAKNFLQNNDKVMLADINEEVLKKECQFLSKSFNENDISYFNLDIRNTESCNQLANITFDKWKSIDILANCAGVHPKNTLVEDTLDEDWNLAIEVNLNGTFKICRSVIKYMKKNKFGRIINIASIAGKEGNPKASHYSTSKAGVIGFTKSLGKELAEDNITANCIAPAVIDTPMIKDVSNEHLNYMIDKIPMKRIGKVEDVVNLINYLSDEKTVFSTGAVFDLSGGRATY